MPGFYITNIEPVTPLNFGGMPCRLEQMKTDDFYIFRNTREQFIEDKLFIENHEYVIVLESVILNKQELIQKYGESSLKKTIEKMIQQKGENFFTELRGMFSGGLYNRKEKSWMIFSDHIGNKAVFYYATQGKIIIGSQLNYVTDTMRNNNIERKIDQNGLRQFLCFGCFMDDSTMIQRVKRLLPGECMIIKDGKVEVKVYHQFTERPIENISDEEAIDLLDSTFRNAMRRGLNKNAEYGYTGIIDISGGADSRMIAYTAKSLGSKNEILCHYSQSGSNEEKIAKRIANELDFEFYYYALDSARFMKDADSIIKMNSGTAYYCGITGGQRMLETLSGRKFGVEFTGLLGDVYEGAMLTTEGDEPPQINYRRYRVTDIIHEDTIDIKIMNRFRTNNMFWLYERGMLCGMSTFFTRQNYVEPYTPYGDVEFLQACLSIPWERKVKNAIQLRWFQKMYPEALRIPYAVTGVRLSSALHPKYLYFINKFRGVQNRFLDTFNLPRKTAMNPIEKWEKEKEWLQQWSKEYFQEGISILENLKIIDSVLLNQIRQMYNTGKGIEKYTVLTMLGYVKQYIL